MRFHFSSVLRTLYTFSTLTRIRAAQQNPLLQSSPQRATALRSMPSIPILGSLFGSKAADASKMSFPDQRSNDEWRAVLNKGMFYEFICDWCQCARYIDTKSQNNSASSARKALSPQGPASSISITLPRGCIRALDVKRRCTRRLTSSAVGVAGLPTLTASPAPSCATRITPCS